MSVYHHCTIMLCHANMRHWRTMHTMQVLFSAAGSDNIMWLREKVGEVSAGVMLVAHPVEVKLTLHSHGTPHRHTGCRLVGQHPAALCSHVSLSVPEAPPRAHVCLFWVFHCLV